MHDLSKPSNWKAFINYMEPCIKYLEADNVVEYIVAKTGKRTLVIGVDESLMCKDERSRSFFRHLENLAWCNSITSSVFVFASSLSAFTMRKGWEKLVKFPESAFLLHELPLPLLQDDIVGNEALFLSFKSNPDLAPALALASGHPRSIWDLYDTLKDNPRAQLPSLVRQRSEVAGNTWHTYYCSRRNLLLSRLLRW